MQGWASGIHYRATKKSLDNQVITNKLVQALHNRSASHFDRDFTQKAQQEQFGVSKDQKMPKGYAIHFNDGKNTYSRNNDWKPGTYYVTKGYSILQTNLESREAALKWVQDFARQRSKGGKVRFTPPQLAHVRRTGPDYRSGQEITGQHYLDTFGFRGGEFGNWMNQNDRQASLNMGFEALKDLAAALQISDQDIAFGGTLAIACPVPAVRRLPLLRRPAAQMPGKHRADAGCTSMATSTSTLAGATYGIYNNGELVDTYTTGPDGSFMTRYYVCGDSWTVREIEPSTGYLLNDTVYEVGASPALYEVELNTTENQVTETVIYGNIQLVKHTDDPDPDVSEDENTEEPNEGVIEHPEAGAVFEIYLKAAGSYDAAKESERDLLTTDSDGFTSSKMLPYGHYTVHQTAGEEGKAFIPDFTVFISADGQTYSYILNNRTITARLKVEKCDAETGSIIPMTGTGFQMCFADGMSFDAGTWDEKITDSLNYLFLLKAIVKEGQTNQQN